MTLDQSNLNYPQLYVVVRFNGNTHGGPLEQSMAIVSAFTSAKNADAEAQRLSRLNAHLGARYVVIVTRLKG